MITHSTSDDIYIGRGAGKRLKGELDKAQKSVKIISPYLTPSYVEDLISLSKKGVEVTLITSNDVEQGDGNYSSFTHTDLIKQKRHTDEEEKELRSKGMKYSLIGLVLPILLFYLSYYLIAGVSLVVVGFVFYHFYDKRIYSYSYYSPIKLKVVPDEYHDRDNGRFFIHSKVYVIDGRVAYLGSVNYTYKAFKSNYETITRISSQKAVWDISKEVDRLFNDNVVGSKDIEEWGQELYPEPKH